MTQKAAKAGLRDRVVNGAFLYTMLAILIGFIVGAVALLIAGYNPFEAYASLISMIFKSPKNISYSFIEFATPYILTGLSVAFSFKTGIFNIGAEGQYIMGSCAALVVGMFVKAPAFIHIPLCILAAMAAGAAWGGLVGFLKVKFGSHEVLCMIMFNWIAYYFSNFLAMSKLMNAGGGKTWTEPIQDTAKITISSWFPKNAVSPKAHFGIVLAIIAVIIIYYIINRTTMGYRMKACGFNRSAAEYAGINANRSIMTALAISGALAALAGGLQVLGVTYKITQFAGQESYGFQGITVALIGNTNPIGVFFAGLFYGAMKFGGTRFGPPSEIVDIIMGCIVFFIAVSTLMKSLFQRRRKVGA